MIMTFTNIELAIMGTIALFISFTIGKRVGLKQGIENTLQYLHLNDCLDKSKINFDDED